MIKNIFPSKIYEIGERNEKFADGGQVKMGYGGAGGYLVGRPHSKGGIKAIVKSTNQPIEVEGGEVIITKPAVEDKKLREFEGEMLTNRQILSRINQSGGGVEFADGGEVPHQMNLSGKIYKYGGKTMSDREIVKMMAMGGVAELPSTESLNITLRSVGITNNPLADARIVQTLLSDLDVPAYIMYGDAYYNGKRYNGRIWVELPDERVVDVHAKEILGSNISDRAFHPTHYEIEYYGSNYDILPLLSDEVMAYAYGGELIDPKKARQILKDGTAHGEPLTEKQKRFMYASMNQKMSLGGIVSDVMENPNFGGLFELILIDKFRISSEIEKSLTEYNTEYLKFKMIAGTEFFEKLRLIYLLVGNNPVNKTFKEGIFNRDIDTGDFDMSYLGLYWVLEYIDGNKYYHFFRDNNLYGDKKFDKYFDSLLLVRTDSNDRFLHFIELDGVSQKDGKFKVGKSTYGSFVDIFNLKLDEIKNLEAEKSKFMGAQLIALGESKSLRKKYYNYINTFLYGKDYRKDFPSKQSDYEKLFGGLGGSKNFSQKVELIQGEIAKLGLLKSDVISIVQPELYNKISADIDTLYGVLSRERQLALTSDVLFDALKRKYSVEMPLFANDRATMLKSKLPTPFGKPSQLSVEDAEIVRTANFKLWFGDWETAGKLGAYDGVSQAYNRETGEPIVVYQGDIGFRTRFGFAGFPVNYFANNYSYARWFAETTYENKRIDADVPPTIYSFFLRMVNPIDLREFGYQDGLVSGWIDVFAKILNVEPRAIYPNFQSQDDLNNFLNANVPLWAMLRNNINLLNYIKNQTFFDGIIMVENNPADVINGEENFTDSYMIFENENVKLSNASFFNTTQSIEKGSFDDFRFKKGGML